MFFQRSVQENESPEKSKFLQIMALRKEINPAGNVFQNMYDNERLKEIDKRVPFEVFALDLGIPMKFVSYHEAMHHLFSTVKLIVALTPENKFTDFRKIEGTDYNLWWTSSIAKLEYQELLDCVRGHFTLKSPEDILEMIRETNRTGRNTYYQGLSIDPETESFCIQTVSVRAAHTFCGDTSPCNNSRYTVDEDGMLYEEHYNQVLDNVTGQELCAASYLTTEDPYGQRVRKEVKKDEYKHLADPSSRQRS